MVLGDKAGEEIAVGVKVKLFITSDRPSNNRVFESHAYNKDWLEDRKICQLIEV